MERKLNVSSRKPFSKVRSSRRRPGCIRLFVCPTTGGRLEISVSPLETVLGLKAALARKLRVSPSKISLIYKDKVLKGGCIQDHQIPDDSHVTLLPNMESGLSVNQSDKSIMQALENLTETQVNDFLSGRSPLMLAIRMGDNMVFVQLQLSMLQGQRQTQPCPSVTPAAAAVLSQSGLSPSAIAEATRCLSQRIHRLQEINRTSTLRPEPPVVPQNTSSPSSRNGPTQALMQQSHRPPALARIPDSSMPSPPPSPGAVIDSMKHLGRGIYTGTFQGTLDPSLQDMHGQPRRNVSTILHILNDLLVANPSSSTPNFAPAPAPKSHPPPANTISSLLMSPPSPSFKTNSAQPSDNPENIALRGKMQHIQMMLAHKKQQRKTRREMCSPYTVVRHTQEQSSVIKVSKSSTVTSSSSVCMAANDGSTDQSSTYCKPSIEQDTLAV
ncbi:midnolin [Biomphalaria pfeifferi]|uniref:Midnolin n=1 Tax=Biomphalaria pfeifferi TaxID=112525 RepID=A0AAD8CC93_BIOPF|nr:midnolin [Biomphalaria pfeifferi]